MAPTGRGGHQFYYKKWASQPEHSQTGRSNLKLTQKFTIQELGILKMSESQTGGGKYPGIGDKADLDNHANQCNPNNPNYEGRPKGYPGDGSKADLDNRSNQLNPNNERYQEKK